MTDDITFVGLDVSKDTISVGVAPGNRREAAHYYGTIAHSPAALSKLAIDRRPNGPAKSSRDRSGRRVTSPQPHPKRPLRSPKSRYASAAIIADPVKSP